ncbi:uncharacterized protein AB675_9281 [Cyphellophora attinorum]|uniref:Involucrin repeat protein n=1 Tax=Cyphellophora attinorum TaxID=1664694 RepID=A0A0N1P113_9EURO|nr:uncharacterized protein AB675_9281 [Phialophora attinorum]KPI41412.1 hypothetical protein AB675_9281 [Phialophora attinorum]
MPKSSSSRSKRDSEGRADRRRDTDDGSSKRSRADSDAGTSSRRKSNPRDDDIHDGEFLPSSTSYSSTSRSPHPGVAAPSLASSYVSAQTTNNNNGTVRPAELIRNESMADTAEMRRERELRRERKAEKRSNRNGVVDGTDDLPRNVENDRDQERRNYSKETSRGYNNDEATLPDDRARGQEPARYTGTDRPPRGQASSYYGDDGQSVAYQPGVRPDAPSVVYSAEQAHLMEPTTKPNPPPEPSSMGQTGAAATYFGTGAYETTSTPSRSDNKTKSRSDKRNGRDSESRGDARARTGHAAEYFSGAPISAGQPYRTESPESFVGTSRPQGQQYGTGQTDYQSQGFANAAGFAGSAAAVYAAGKAHDRPQNHDSQPDPGFRLGQNQSAFPQMQDQYRQKRKGPLSKLANFFKDPEGVARFEQYSEAVGVCKYCFDPNSSPMDAPRKHHYHGRRNSSKRRYDAAGRVEKGYRYSSSSDDERKRKSGMGQVIAGGLAGVGAAKIGQALYDRKHDFDDTYSVKTGQPYSSHPANRSRVSFQEDVATSSRGLSLSKEEDRSKGRSSRRKDEKRRSRRRNSSSSSSSNGISKTAALGLGTAGIAAGLAASSRPRSRSPSKRKGYYSKRISPKHSYVDLNDTSAGTFGFNQFRSPSQNDKKGKRAKGFFNFSNSSGSSSDADLAFGQGTVRRKDSRRFKRKNSSEFNIGTAAALTAAGMALASESDSRGKGKSSRYADVYREKAQADGRNKIKLKDHETTTDADNDDGWYDTDGEHGVSSGEEGGLAYGRRASPAQSKDSVIEEGGWWPWSTPTKSSRGSRPRRAEQDTPSRINPMTAAAIGAGVADIAANTMAHRDQSRNHRDASQPMQEIEPIPASDFVPPSSSQPSRSASGQYISTRDQVPLQQPQPVVPLPLVAGALADGARDERRTAVQDYESRRRRRRDSSPAKMPSQSSRVGFDVPDKASRKPREDSRERTRQEKKERRRTVDFSELANDDEKRAAREAEIEAELQRLYDEDRRRAAEKKREKAITTAAAVAVGASVAAASAISKKPRESSSERERPTARKSSMKKTTRDAGEPQPAESQQERIARMAAQRVRSTSPAHSVEHESYSDYFVPKELAEQIQEHNLESAARNEHHDHDVVEIAPGGEHLGPFEKFNYAIFGTEPHHDPLDHPWAIPTLALVEPTPPVSRNTSRAASPAVRSPATSPVKDKDVPAAVDADVNADIGEPLERRGSKVKWGDHDTYVYEVITPEYERSSYMPESPEEARPSDAVRNAAAAAASAAAAAAMSKSVSKERKPSKLSRVQNLADGDGETGEKTSRNIPAVEEMSPQQREHLSKGGDFGDMPGTFDRSSTADDEEKERQQAAAREATLARIRGIAKNAMDSRRKPIDGQPADVAELTGRGSRSERRRSERAGTIQDTVQGDPPPATSDSHVPSAGVFDYLVDEDGQPLRPASALQYEGSGVSNRTPIEHERVRPRAHAESERDKTREEDGAFSKPKRASTFGEYASDEKQNSKGRSAYSSDPEDRERSRERSRDGDKRASKSDVGFGTTAAVAAGTAAASLAAIAAQASNASDKKTKRRSKREDDIIGDDDADSVISSPASRDDDKKSRRRSKRDSEIFDDDDRSVTSSTADSSSRKKSKDKKEEKRSSGIFGSIFGGSKSDTSTTSKKSSKSAKSDSKSAKDDDEGKQRKRRSKGEDSFDVEPAPYSRSVHEEDEKDDSSYRPSRDQSVDDGFVSADEHRAVASSQDHEEPSFLAERPEMPPQRPTDTPMATDKDGVSGPTVTTERDLQLETPPGDAETATQTPVSNRARPVAALRTSELGNVPGVASPTAVPISFRRPPPTSPATPRAFFSSPIPSPQSPLNTPRTRQGRPKSTEFRSTEFRPLFLVEKSRSEKTPIPEVEEDLPSLPSSRTTSARASFEDLRGAAEQQDHVGLESRRPKNEDRPRRHSASWWDDETTKRRQSPDYLDSRAATPVPINVQRKREEQQQREQRERRGRDRLADRPELKYEFHSPSELLQDPATLAETTGAEVPEEVPRVGSPLPSVASTEDFMSATEGPHSERSRSRSRSGSRGRRDTITAAGLGVGLGALGAYGASEWLAQREPGRNDEHVITEDNDMYGEDTHEARPGEIQPRTIAPEHEQMAQKRMPEGPGFDGVPSESVTADAQEDRIAPVPGKKSKKSKEKTTDNANSAGAEMKQDIAAEIPITVTEATPAEDFAEADEWNFPTTSKKGKKSKKSKKATPAPLDIATAEAKDEEGHRAIDDDDVPLTAVPSLTPDSQLAPHELDIDRSVGPTSPIDQQTPAPSDEPTTLDEFRDRDAFPFDTLPANETISANPENAADRTEESHLDLTPSLEETNKPHDTHGAFEEAFERAVRARGLSNASSREEAHNAFLPKHDNATQSSLTETSPALDEQSERVSGSPGAGSADHIEQAQPAWDDGFSTTKKSKKEKRKSKLRESVHFDDFVEASPAHDSGVLIPVDATAESIELDDTQSGLKSAAELIEAPVEANEEEWAPLSKKDKKKKKKQSRALDFSESAQPFEEPIASPFTATPDAVDQKSADLVDDHAATTEEMARRVDDNDAERAPAASDGDESKLDQDGAAQLESNGARLDASAADTIHDVQQTTNDPADHIAEIEPMETSTQASVGDEESAWAPQPSKKEKKRMKKQRRQAFDFDEPSDIVEEAPAHTALIDSGADVVADPDNEYGVPSMSKGKKSKKDKKRNDTSSTWSDSMYGAAVATAAVAGGTAAMAKTKDDDEVTQPEITENDALSGDIADDAKQHVDPSRDQRQDEFLTADIDAPEKASLTSTVPSAAIDSDVLNEESETVDENARPSNEPAIEPAEDEWAFPVKKSKKDKRRDKKRVPTFDEIAEPSAVSDTLTTIEQPTEAPLGDDPVVERSASPLDETMKSESAHLSAVNEGSTLQADPESSTMDNVSNPSIDHALVPSETPIEEAAEDFAWAPTKKSKKDKKKAKRQSNVDLSEEVAQPETEKSSPADGGTAPVVEDTPNSTLGVLVVDSNVTPAEAVEVEAAGDDAWAPTKKSKKDKKKIKRQSTVDWDAEPLESAETAPTSEEPGTVAADDTIVQPSNAGPEADPVEAPPDETSQMEEPVVEAAPIAEDFAWSQTSAKRSKKDKKKRKSVAFEDWTEDASTPSAADPPVDIPQEPLTEVLHESGAAEAASLLPEIQDEINARALTEGQAEMNKRGDEVVTQLQPPSVEEAENTEARMMETAQHDPVQQERTEQDEINTNALMEGQAEIEKQDNIVDVAPHAPSREELENVEADMIRTVQEDPNQPDIGQLDQSSAQLPKVVGAADRDIESAAAPAEDEEWALPATGKKEKKKKKRASTFDFTEEPIKTAPSEPTIDPAAATERNEPEMVEDVDWDIALSSKERKKQRKALELAGKWPPMKRRETLPDAATEKSGEDPIEEPAPEPEVTTENDVPKPLQDSALESVEMVEDTDWDLNLSSKEKKRKKKDLQSAGNWPPMKPKDVSSASADSAATPPAQVTEDNEMPIPAEATGEIVPLPEASTDPLMVETLDEQNPPDADDWALPLKKSKKDKKKAKRGSAIDDFNDSAPAASTTESTSHATDLAPEQAAEVPTTVEDTLDHDRPGEELTRDADPEQQVAEDEWNLPGSSKKSKKDKKKKRATTFDWDASAATPLPEAASDEHAPTAATEIELPLEGSVVPELPREDGELAANTIAPETSKGVLESTANLTTGPDGPLSSTGMDREVPESGADNFADAATTETILNAADSIDAPERPPTHLDERTAVANREDNVPDVSAHDAADRSIPAAIVSEALGREGSKDAMADDDRSLLPDKKSGPDQLAEATPSAIGEDEAIVSSKATELEPGPRLQELDVDDIGHAERPALNVDADTEEPEQEDDTWGFTTSKKSKRDKKKKKRTPTFDFDEPVEASVPHVEASAKNEALTESSVNRDVGLDSPLAGPMLEGDDGHSLEGPHSLPSATPAVQTADESAADKTVPSVVTEPEVEDDWGFPLSKKKSKKDKKQKSASTNSLADPDATPASLGDAQVQPDGRAIDDAALTVEPQSVIETDDLDRVSGQGVEAVDDDFESLSKKDKKNKKKKRGSTFMFDDLDEPTAGARTDELPKSMQLPAEDTQHNVEDDASTTQLQEPDSTQIDEGGVSARRRDSIAAEAKPVDAGDNASAPGPVPQFVEDTDWDLGLSSKERKKKEKQLRSSGQWPPMRALAMPDEAESIGQQSAIDSVPMDESQQPEVEMVEDTEWDLGLSSKERKKKEKQLRSSGQWPPMRALEMPIEPAQKPAPDSVMADHTQQPEVDMVEDTEWDFGLNNKERKRKREQLKADGNWPPMRAVERSEQVQSAALPAQQIISEEEQSSSLPIASELDSFGKPGSMDWTISEKQDKKSKKKKKRGSAFDWNDDTPTSGVESGMITPAVAESHEKSMIDAVDGTFAAGAAAMVAGLPTYDIDNEHIAREIEADEPQPSMADTDDWALPARKASKKDKKKRKQVPGAFEDSGTATPSTPMELEEQATTAAVDADADKGPRPRERSVAEAFDDVLLMDNLQRDRSAQSHERWALEDEFMSGETPRHDLVDDGEMVADSSETADHQKRTIALAPQISENFAGATQEVDGQATTDTPSAHDPMSEVERVLSTTTTESKKDRKEKGQSTSVGELFDEATPTAPIEIMASPVEPTSTSASAPETETTRGEPLEYGLAEDGSWDDASSQSKVKKSKRRSSEDLFETQQRGPSSHTQTEVAHESIMPIFGTLAATAGAAALASDDRDRLREGKEDVSRASLSKKSKKEKKKNRQAEFYEPGNLSGHAAEASDDDESRAADNHADLPADERQDRMPGDLEQEEVQEYGQAGSSENDQRRNRSTEFYEQADTMDVDNFDARARSQDLYADTAPNEPLADADQYDAYGFRPPKKSKKGKRKKRDSNYDDEIGEDIAAPKPVSYDISQDKDLPYVPTPPPAIAEDSGPELVSSPQGIEHEIFQDYEASPEPGIAHTDTKQEVDDWYTSTSKSRKSKNKTDSLSFRRADTVDNITSMYGDQASPRSKPSQSEDSAWGGGRHRSNKDKKKSKAPIVWEEETPSLDSPSKRAAAEEVADDWYSASPTSKKSGKGKRSSRSDHSLPDDSSPVEAWSKTVKRATSGGSLRESDGSEVSASTRERRRRRRQSPIQQDWAGEEPPDLPRDRALTPPPERDDVFDTALGVATAIGFGAGSQATEQRDAKSRHRDMPQDEPSCSFADVKPARRDLMADVNRDSGVQFESPIVGTAEESVRDSGYGHDWERDPSHREHLRPVRPQSPTSSSEDVRRHVSAREHATLGRDYDQPYSPDPIQSTSKDRSSVVFKSSPTAPGSTPRVSQIDTSIRRLHSPDGLHRSPSVHGPHSSRDGSVHRSLDSRLPGSPLASNLIDRASMSGVDRTVFSPSPTSTSYPRSPPKSPLHSIPEDGSQSHTDNLTKAAVVTGIGGVLGAAALASARDSSSSKTLGRSKSRTSSLRNLRGSLTSPIYEPNTGSSTPRNIAHDRTDDGGRAAAVSRNMADFDGYGHRPASPMSPTRPPSITKRRSMQQIQDLQTRLEQLADENRSLAEAKITAERHLEEFHLDQHKSEYATQEALRTAEAQLRERDENIIKLQSEIAGMAQLHQSSRGGFEGEEDSRELEALRAQHTELSQGMDSIIRHEIDAAMMQKNAEVERLQRELAAAKEEIRELQSQILARGVGSNADDGIVDFKDEDYFDAACQQLCQHVQQWVLRFSKHSDNRVCRRTDEVRDEKIVDRFDNAILDGSDVDIYLADRVRRRDVFMSVVMTMIWEYVFTRYLFGMDRDQRQKLKQLEKNLSEVGPVSSVNRWRSITLSMLSKRGQFKSQCDNDTEAVAIEVYNTLSKFLPPPNEVQNTIVDSLLSVMRKAVDLSVEMRCQKQEYLMLPPLQPEYDTNGDLAQKVYFKAALMNERSGETRDNGELERDGAVVRMVLFPLVVSKALIKDEDDGEEREEEVVVCPAQVLVAREDARRSKSRQSAGTARSASQRVMSMDAKSTGSLMSGVEAAPATHTAATGAGGVF